MSPRGSGSLPALSRRTRPGKRNFTRGQLNFSHRKLKFPAIFRRKLPKKVDLVFGKLNFLRGKMIFLRRNFVFPAGFCRKLSGFLLFPPRSQVEAGLTTTLSWGRSDLERGCSPRTARDCPGRGLKGLPRCFGGRVRILHPAELKSARERATTPAQETKSSLSFRRKLSAKLIFAWAKLSFSREEMNSSGSFCREMAAKLIFAWAKISFSREEMSSSVCFCRKNTGFVPPSGACVRCLPALPRFIREGTAPCIEPRHDPGASACCIKP